MSEPVFKKPNIVSREDWGAKPPSKLDISCAPTRIVVHHSASPNVGQWKGRATLKGIQNFHMQSRGMLDIAYHFVIAPDGTVYQGVPVGIRGSHCGGEVPEGAARCFGNTGSIGICVIGDFDSENVPVSAWNALISLMDWLKAEYKIPENQVFGHFEAWTRPPKTCPGKRLAVALFGASRWRNAFPGKGA